MDINGLVDKMVQSDLEAEFKAMHGEFAVRGKYESPTFMLRRSEAEYARIKVVSKENWITEGPRSKAFMDQLLQLTGAKYGVFAPNGTLAIYLGLIAAGIEEGDEVIVPDFTFLGSASAVVMAGGTPVFCDVNRHNFQARSRVCRKGNVLKNEVYNACPCLWHLLAKCWMSCVLRLSIN